MKKSNVLWTAFWVVITILYCGLYKFGKYEISIYYSNLAPEQLGDDSAYGLLKFQSTAENIAKIIFILGILFILYRLYRIWFKGDKNKEAK